MKPLFLPLKRCVFLCIFGILGIALYAQTAAEIETLLGIQAVTYAQAAGFVLKASEAAASSPEEAFKFAAERNWLPKDASQDAEARLDGLSLLVMQSFGIKGGIFYSLFKNPHYSYRELVSKSVIQGKTYPKRAVSGEMLLFITGRVLAIMEDAESNN